MAITDLQSFEQSIVNHMGNVVIHVALTEAYFIRCIRIFDLLSNLYREEKIKKMLLIFAFLEANSHFLVTK